MKIKKLLLSLFAVALSAVSASAQVPEMMRFQTLVRNAKGLPVTESNVSVRITLFNGATKTDLYSETFGVTTDALGIANIDFGTGETASGTTYASFADIDWTSTNENPIWMRVEIDPTGGSDYSVINGESQLLTAPYAMMTKKAMQAEVAKVSENTKLVGNLQLTNATLQVESENGVELPTFMLAGTEIADGQSMQLLAYTPTYFSLNFATAPSATNFRIQITLNGKAIKSPLLSSYYNIQGLKIPVATDNDGVSWAYYGNVKVSGLSSEDWDYGTVNMYSEQDNGTSNTYGSNQEFMIGPFLPGQENVIKVSFIRVIY